MSSFLASLMGHDRSTQQPCLIFQGPDTHGNVRAINPFNQEIASFHITKSTITRTRPIQQQICTFKRSSLSGTTTLEIRGQKIKVKQSWEGMQYGKDMDTPMGKWKFRPGSGGYEELRDSRKVLLARGKLHSSLRKREAHLEVFVTGDEALLDLILAAWMSMCKSKDSESEEVEAVAEVVGAVGGA